MTRIPPTLTSLPALCIVGMRSTCTFNHCFFCEWGDAEAAACARFGTTVIYRMQVYAGTTPHCLIGCASYAKPLQSEDVVNLSAGTYAVFTPQLCPPHALESAWQYAFESWLPTSGYTVTPLANTFAILSLDSPPALYLPVRSIQSRSKPSWGK